ncbi:MAG: Chitinase [Myxococcaceae bacterium]|nr:Chitinase [Myxococcaceae bacterium]
MSSRRLFLKCLVTCAAASTSAACGASARSGAGSSASGDAPAGNISGLPVSAILLVPEIEACVLRDAAGIYAMTLVCTHEGCDIALEGSVSAAGIICHCHGSQFDLNGTVLVGPANEDLQHFLVSADKHGNLTVHGTVVVDPSTRLPA